MSAELRLPPGWNNLSIDELKANSKASIAIGPFGSRMKSDCYVESGIPVIRGTNLTGGRVFKGEFVFISKEKAKELGGANVYKNDIVFPHRGAIGEVGILTEAKQYVMSSSLMKLTCDKTKVEPLFLYYFFKSKLGRHELLKNASQVGTPGIGQPLTSLKSIRINLPPIVEQKQIVKILNRLDNKIELNRQINQTLEQIAQAIFKSWFVDFEPVKAKIGAKANGQDPERAAMCAISGKTDEELDQLSPTQLAQLQTTAALFPDELIDSELGMTPKGWSWMSLKEVIELNPRRTLTKGTVASYLEMKNMPTKGHLAENWRLREMGSGTKFINGDTLMARITPCLENGKTAFVDFLKEDEVGWGSTEYIVMRSKMPLPLGYSYLLARDITFRSFAIQNMTGTSGRQRVTVRSLEDYKVAVADNEKIYNSFSVLTKIIMDQVKCNGGQSKTLTQLRDTLLPKLLSGEIIPENSV